MFTTPTVVGEVLFVGSCSGVAYGIDKTSGEVRWTYDTREDAGPAQFHGDPAVVGDLVLTGSDTAEPSMMYAFRAASGELVWKRESDVIESDVVSVSGLIVGQTYFGDYVALDVTTGERRWRLSTEERRCGRRPQATAAAGKRVYLAAGDGSLKAVRASDGEVLWSRDRGCVSTALELWRGRLWAGTPEGSLFSVDPETGEALSSIDVGGRPHGRPVPVADRVLVLRVGEREAVAVDPEGSRVVWRYRADRELSSPRPHLYQGLHGREELVLVGDSAGLVHALDSRDGSLRWSVEVTGTVRGIGSEPGVLYVGTLGGVVHRVPAPAGSD